jgi:hypothetical protein
VNTVEVATPLELVVSVSVVDEFDANVPLAPVAGATKVTATPPTGFESLSRTVTTRGFANAVLTVALCPPPLVASIVAGAPALFVKVKVAVVVVPGVEAITVYEPVVVFAVGVDEKTTPLELVLSVSVVVPFANVALAPAED